jgi:thioredoxin-related protein
VLLQWFSLLVVAPCTASRAQAVTDVESLARIDDLRVLAAKVQRDRSPLLLFFSTPGCPYCREVRRSYLAPRVREGAAAGIEIREVDITSRRTFAGHDGKSVSELELAARYRLRVAPVVILVNQDLVPLADPLVGIDRAGFYENYLSSAIETARARLAKE